MHFGTLISSWTEVSSICCFVLHLESLSRSHKGTLVCAPFICCIFPCCRLASIAESLSVRDKNEVVSKLQAYWMLKRRQRNGLPLLRRLQAAHNVAGSTVQVSSRIDVAVHSVDLDATDPPILPITCKPFVF